MIKELIRKNRSCRRFRQDRKIKFETLKELVGLARLSPSAANLQPLRYAVSCDPEMNGRIFSCLGWAAYIKNWPGPEEGERPSGYIIVMGDTENANEHIAYDCGIAAHSVLLGAAEKGLAGCMIASVNRKRLGAILDAPSRYKIFLVTAMGRPKEKIVIEKVGTDGNIRYWRDENGVHHVPKRETDDLIIKKFTA